MTTASRTRPSRRRPHGRQSRRQPSYLRDGYITAQLLIVAGLLVVVPLVFWRPAMEPFQTPKATVVWLAALASLVITGIEVVSTGRIRRPRTRAYWLVLAVLAAGLLTTVTSSAPSISLWGEYRYMAGLASYTAYGVLFVAALRVVDAGGVTIVAKGTLVGSAVVVSYGLLQWLGLDPFEWVIAAGGVFSTLGQPNYASGYLGATIPFSLALALYPSLTKGWRALAGVVVVAGIVVLVATRSFQGPVAAAAGLVVVAAAYVVDRAQDAPGSVRRRLLYVSTAAITVVAISVAVFHAFLMEQVREGLAERLLMWEGALGLVRDKPVLGTGLDTFGLHFLAYRPMEHAVRYGGTNPEVPHSVPLSMFTGGGVLLGAAYIAFTVYTGWILWRAMRDSETKSRTVIAAVGSAWVGYQIQSLVSMDVPPLAVLHWIFAAAIIALGVGRQPVEVRLPWYRPSLRRRSGRLRSAVALVASLAVASVVGGLLTRPMRADVDAARAVGLANAGAFEAATDSIDDATDLADYRSTYWLVNMGVARAAGNLASARRAAERAALADFGSARQAIAVAELAQQAGDQEAAVQWFLEAVERDPHNPEVLLPAAAFLEDRGRSTTARQLRQRALRATQHVVTADSRDAQMLLRLANAYAALGRLSAAAEVYERVLALEPQNTPAQDALSDIRGGKDPSERFG